MILPIILSSALAASPAPENACTATAIAPQRMDIVETAVAAGSFKTLAAALEAADLVHALKGEGPFTVFAPTDDAFAALPAGTLDTLLKPENKGLLQAILTYHVVPGAIGAAQVVELDYATTLNGQRVDIAVNRAGVMVDDAMVIHTDIRASNGVIHVIDAVILPSTIDIVATAIEAGSFPTLVAAVQAAGLVEALQGDGPFTVFAPTEAAFAALPAGLLEDLLKPENKDRLAALLTYHVVPGAVYADAAAAGATVTTLNGGMLKTGTRAGKVVVNGAEVVQADIEANNGVIHVINKVLIP